LNFYEHNVRSHVELVAKELDTQLARNVEVMTRIEELQERVEMIGK